MKITIVLGAFFPVPPIMGGAVEKVWFVLAQEFARRGHEIVQISRTHPSFPRTENIAGVKHLRVPGFAQPRSIIWLKLLDFIYSWRVRRVLRKADILVTNTFWLPLLVRDSRYGLLYVHVARGPKGQMRWYSHAARLQAVSASIAEAIVAQAPALAQKVRTLPNALPHSMEEPGETVRTKTILYVGRIHPEKGLELFFRSLSLLPNELATQWTIRIVGPHEAQYGGGGEPFLHKLQAIAQRSVAKVEWRGPIFNETELSAQYRSAMIFVYPSIAETGEALPVAPLEAMANGCVPLVSSLDCFRDYIRDGVTGFVFDHRNNAEQDLAMRLTQLLSLPHDELARMGAAARATTANFRVDVVAEKYLEDFASLLAADKACVPQYSQTLA
jgi:glycosyltransferase involved in cell wall biosynthesis